MLTKVCRYWYISNARLATASPQQRPAVQPINESSNPRSSSSGSRHTAECAATIDLSGSISSYRVVGLFANATVYAACLLTHLGLGPKIAMTCVYLVAATASFLMNRKWTFVHDGNMFGLAVRYALAQLAGYLLILLILFFPRSYAVKLNPSSGPCHPDSRHISVRRIGVPGFPAARAGRRMSAGKEASFHGRGFRNREYVRFVVHASRTSQLIASYFLYENGGYKLRPPWQRN